MKVYLRDVQKDLISLPMALQIYPQANLTLFRGGSNNMPSTYDPQPPTPTFSKFHCLASNTLGYGNNVQQHEVDLIEHKSKMMTQFQELLALLKSANNVQSAPVPANRNNNNNKTKRNNTGKSQTSVTSTAGHTEAVLILARNATAKLIVTKMSQPSCLEVDELNKHVSPH